MQWGETTEGKQKNELTLPHEARRGVHSCVQAAAAARVAAGRDILESAGNGDGVSVLCHLIADADAVNKRDG